LWAETLTELFCLSLGEKTEACEGRKCKSDVFRHGNLLQMWLRQAVGRISRKSSRSGVDDLKALSTGTPIAKIAQGK
jgi:hypothetical protein